LYHLKYYFIKLALQKIASQLSILLEKITNQKEIDAMTKTLDSASTTCFLLEQNCPPNKAWGVDFLL
jgi:hypothetical protein